MSTISPTTFCNRLDRNGRVTKWDYDRLYRVLQERWYTDADHLANDPGAPVRQITSRYDSAGRQTELSDPDATYTYAYDTLDRTVSELRQLADLTMPVSFVRSFDRNHLRVETQAWLGSTADFINTYEFDNLHRLRQLEQQSSPEPAANAVAHKRIEFDYDLANQLTELRRYSPPTSTVVDSQYRFDQVGRLEKLDHRGTGGHPLAGYTYTYTADNRMSSIVSSADQTIDASGSLQLEYDARGQLTHETYDYANYRQQRNYQYDANGNRASVTTSDTTGAVLDTDTYTTLTNNRLMDDGRFVYTYDNEGNRLTRTEHATGVITSYEWDHRNRLTTVTTQAGDTPFEAGGEVGQVFVTQTAADQWTTVPLQRSYADPVVIVSPASRDDADPTTVRIRHVTPQSFELQLDEWDYQDGVHSQESVGYVVVEAGSYTLADGTRLEAGRLAVDHTWTEHRFRSHFTHAPVVLASVMSAHDEPAVTPRFNELDNQGFRVKLKEQELFSTDPDLRAHAYEQVGYLALSGQRRGRPAGF